MAKFKFGPRAVALAVASLALAGCGPPVAGAGRTTPTSNLPSSSPSASTVTSPAPALPTASVDSDQAMTAALEQTLRKDSEGCVVAGVGKETLALQWPRGFTTRSGAGGEVEVLDRAGVVVARTGQKASLGGGRDETVAGAVKRPCIDRYKHVWFVQGHLPPLT